MTERMKILIAYDGSEYSDAALTDLKRAGLPVEADVSIISIAESWLPPPSSYEILEESGKDPARSGVARSLALAKRAADIVEAFFPTWNFTVEAHHGSASGEVVRKAEGWRADLIVVGSHGFNALGRFVLGSVSHKIVTDSHCSVRVARKRHQVTNAPPRILIGIDGSAQSDLAVRTVAARHWPHNTEARLVTAVGPFMELPEESVENQMQHIREIQTKACELLLKAGLSVSTLIEVADPKLLLISEAEKWDADAIFVGTRGHSRLDRMLLGSVATAVVNRAHCSVEVVRPT